MEQDRDEQDQTLPAPPMPRRMMVARSLETIRIPENLSPAEIQRVLGSAFFNEHACLILKIATAQRPLVVAPMTHTFLGRTEANHPEGLYLNLSQYGARDKGVSTIHAVLHRSDVTLSIQDLDSMNGTYLNGSRLSTGQIQILKDNDQIILGAFRIRIAFQYGSIE